MSDERLPQKSLKLIKRNRNCFWITPVLLVGARVEEEFSGYFLGAKNKERKKVDQNDLIHFLTNANKCFSHSLCMRGPKIELNGIL